MITDPSMNGVSADEAATAIRPRMAPCVAVVLFGFVAAVSFHYWIAAYDAGVYPASTYLFRPADRMEGAPWPGASKHHCFGDFYSVWILANLPTPYEPVAWGRSNYLPLLHALMLPLGMVPFWAIVPVYLAACAFGFFWFCARSLKDLPVADRVIAATALGLMSYPPQILLDRGNTESLVFLFLALFSGYLLRGSSYLAAISLAAAIASKGYPVIFSLLFLARGEVRQFVVCGFASVLFMVLSASLFAGGTIHNLRECIAGIAHYSQLMSSAEGIQHGSSAWGMLGILKDLLQGLWPVDAVCRWLFKNFTIVQLSLAAGLAYAILALRLRIWESLTLFCCAMMMLLSSGPDYRLIHFLIPITVFFRSNELCRWPVAYSTVFGLLLIPKAYVIIRGEISSSSLLNPILMLGLVGMIIWEASGRGLDVGEAGPLPYQNLMRGIRDLVALPWVKRASQDRLDAIA